MSLQDNTETEKDWAEIASLRAEIARLKAAAAGHEMVSEMADMEEVAVLVVGLHGRIARVEQERDALHADLDLQIKRTEEARNDRDALREDLKACAEALQSVVDSAHAQTYLKMRTIEKALARPGVQKALDTPADA